MSTRRLNRAYRLVWHSQHAGAVHCSGGALLRECKMAKHVGRAWESTFVQRVFVLVWELLGGGGGGGSREPTAIRVELFRNAHRRTLTWVLIHTHTGSGKRQ
jgi:hypothetical protein